MTVRTRIAPSPTGAPHVGTAYMALFNLVFARKHGGQMVLRIEDTDQSRSSKESEDAILSSLKWLGLDWDEGPDCGGNFGPYRQSERLDLYKEAIQKLVNAGYAYPCFCSAERLNELRKKQIENKETPRYDGHCLNLSKEEIERKIQSGEKYVYRLKIPDDGVCLFNDELRGEVKFEWRQIDHQIIQKSDGFPTYHLASIVDDYHMGITHVIRGEEWINSTPKHILLYEGLGWKAPVFAHLPLLRNPDKSKLSKRKNPTSIDYYKDAGFIPEALVNYLGMMGYTLPDQREIFNINEMSESFDIKRISLGGPIFDIAKLKWLNGRYLREQMTTEEVLQRMIEWKANPDFFGKILPLALKRLETLSDFFPLSQFLLNDSPEYSLESLIEKLDGEDVAKLLKVAEWEMEKIPEWSRDELSALFQKISEVEKIKLKQVLAPFFVAISGGSVSLPLFDSLEILGPDLTRTRIRTALEKLASEGMGLSKKGLKKLEKEYSHQYGNRID